MKEEIINFPKPSYPSRYDLIQLGLPNIIFDDLKGKEFSKTNVLSFFKDFYPMHIPKLVSDFEYSLDKLENFVVPPSFSYASLYSMNDFSIKTVENKVFDDFVEYCDPFTLNTSNDLRNFSALCLKFKEIKSSDYINQLFNKIDPACSSLSLSGSLFGLTKLPGSEDAHERIHDFALKHECYFDSFLIESFGKSKELKEEALLRFFERIENCKLFNSELNSFSSIVPGLSDNEKMIFIEWSKNNLNKLNGRTKISDTFFKYSKHVLAGNEWRMNFESFRLSYQISYMFKMTSQLKDFEKESCLNLSSRLVEKYEKEKADNTFFIPAVKCLQKFSNELNFNKNGSFQNGVFFVALRAIENLRTLDDPKQKIELRKILSEWKENLCDSVKYAISIGSTILDNPKWYESIVREQLSDLGLDKKRTSEKIPDRRLMSLFGLEDKGQLSFLAQEISENKKEEILFMSAGLYPVEAEDLGIPMSETFDM